jgi:hypothetical protein
LLGAKLTTPDLSCVQFCLFFFKVNHDMFVVLVIIMLNKVHSKDVLLQGVIVDLFKIFTARVDNLIGILENIMLMVIHH